MLLLVVLVLLGPRLVDLWLEAAALARRLALVRNVLRVYPYAQSWGLRVLPASPDGLLVA